MKSSETTKPVRLLGPLADQQRQNEQQPTKKPECPYSEARASRAAEIKAEPVQIEVEKVIKEEE